jgi:Fe-S-cluster containining protein
MENKISPIYKTIREKIVTLQEKVDFQCLKCSKTCCSRNIERIPLLEGDYKLLEQNKADLTGIHRYETGQCHLRRALENKYCYYYNEESGLCTIHFFKPLYCLMFPFDFKLVPTIFQGKPVKKLKRLYFPNPYCRWVKEKYNKKTMDKKQVTKIQNLIEKYLLVKY